MKQPSATVIAATVIIGTAGFFIGRISSSGPGADAGNSALASGIRDGGASAGAGDAGSAGIRSLRSSSRGDERRTSPAKLSGPEALARLEAIVRGENALDRNRALMAFIDQLGPDEFESAVAHFRSLGITDSRFGEYGLLLTAWAETNPVQALDYVRANTNGGFALNTVLATWASKDAEGAIAWAEANHSGDGANPFMPGIIRAVAATDLNRASDLLTALPRSRERGEALDGFLSHLLRSGPDAAREWASSLSDQALRDGSISRLAGRLAETDPAGTARWLLNNPGEALNDEMDNVVGSWAARDQAAALSFFKTLPQGEVRNDAFRGIISAVASSDPRAAASLIDRNMAETDSGTIRSFVWHSFRQEPELALDYVSRITDANDQERTYSRALDFWLNRDPAKAQAWIDSNNLPPKVVEQLQQRTQPPQ